MHVQRSPSVALPAGVRGGSARRRAGAPSDRRPNDLRYALKEPLRLALVLGTIIGISRIHQHFGFIAAVRPGLLLFLFCTAYALLVPSSVQWDILKRNWPARGVLYMSGLALLGIPMGLSLGGSATFMIDVYSRVLIIFFILVAATRSLQDVRLWIWGFLISVLLLLWMAIFVLDMTTVGTGTLQRLQASYMYDGNDLGVLLMAGIPLALLMLHVSGTVGRLISLAVLLGVPVVVALTASRGAFLGLAVVAASLFVLASHVALVKRLALGAVLAGGIVLAAPEGYWEQMRTIIEPGDDYNLTADAGRKAIWTRGVGYMARYPILGVGLDNFTRAEATISDLARNHIPGTGMPVLAPHNTFLQAGAELGIPALLIWISFFWVAIVTLTRIRRRLPRNWARGSPDERFLYFATIYLPVTFLGVASTTFFVSHLYLPGIYTLLAILGGVLMELDRRIPGVVSGRAGRRGKRAAASLPGRPGSPASGAPLHRGPGRPYTQAGPLQ